MTNESPAMGPDGRPQAMAERCSTCVFRPGNLMRLQGDRLRAIIAGNREAGAVLTCHQTLSYGSHPELGQAACRGFLDAYPDVQAARIAEALLGGWCLVQPPDPTWGEAEAEARRVAALRAARRAAGDLRRDRAARRRPGRRGPAVTRPTDSPREDNHR